MLNTSHVGWSRNEEKIGLLKLPGVHFEIPVHCCFVSQLWHYLKVLCFGFVCLFLLCLPWFGVSPYSQRNTIA